MSLSDLFLEIENWKRETFSKQHRVGEYMIANCQSDFIFQDAEKLEDCNFWIEGGDRSCFLMTWVRDHIECVGGCDLVGDKWISSINTEYDEENDTDLEIVHESTDKIKALEALWNAKERSIV